MAASRLSIQRRINNSVRFRANALAIKTATGPIAAALRKRASISDLTDGVTVITVNYNTLDYLRAMVAAVRHFSDRPVRIMVVDNHSSDGSCAWVRRQGDIDLIRLPVNILHGPAMDIGILRCRTTHFVALDVDAFPISPSWLEQLLDPLDTDVFVSGASYAEDLVARPQPYVHACCLAMRTRDFSTRGHTFRPRDGGDTAQSISMREWPRVHLLPLNSSRGPGILGSVFGHVVYHNFYSARFAVTSHDTIDIIDRGQPEQAWSEAVDKYLGDLSLR